MREPGTPGDTIPNLFTYHIIPINPGGGFPPVVIVIDPASPIVRASIAECNSTKLLDPSLVSAAVNGAGYSGSINLSLEEARGLGLVTGAEILVLLRSYFAASGNPGAPIEAFRSGQSHFIVAMIGVAVCDRSFRLNVLQPRTLILA